MTAKRVNPRREPRVEQPTRGRAYVKARARYLPMAVACVVLLVAAFTVPAAEGASTAKPYPRDGKLRLNDVQMLGTHNSYHLRPDRELAAEEQADYEHPALDVQLDQGARSLELDTYNGPTFPVLHTMILDDRSNCATIDACLRTIDAWSTANPGHVPLVVLIEPKPLPTNPNPTIQSIIDSYVAEHQLADWDAAAFVRLDATVRRVMGKKLITPDEVRRKRATLRAAIERDGWPTLAKTRGRVLVVLGAPLTMRELYLEGTPSLEGRAMFLPSSPEEPSAAVIKRDIPQPDTFPELAAANFLIKTRADADAVEARVGDLTRANTALASGAHVVATDYTVADPRIGTYVVDLAGTGAVRCNPVTAPKWCRDTDLENPRGLRTR